MALVEILRTPLGALVVVVRFRLPARVNPLPSPPFRFFFRAINWSWIGLDCGLESGGSQSRSRRRQAIRQVPDQAAVIVLDRQKRHAQVDADHNRGRPVSVNIKSVGKAVVAPERSLVLLVNRTSGRNGPFRRKSDRT